MQDNPVAHNFTRHLPLEGGCNFRDIGGYGAADGRVVRWGRVYRTGVLSYLTPADHSRLQQLGVGGIYDLRRANERHHEPTRWCDTTLTPFTWDDGYEPPSVTRFFKNQEDSAQGMRAAMIDLYRALPSWLAPRIHDLLQSLCASSSPVVVHCSAGKDRTGLVIAVLLLALGVSREQVMHDYLLTNELAQLEEFMTSRKFALLGVTDAEHPLLLMPADKRRALLSADPDYLDAAFVQLDRDYGSLDAYLLHAVGLTTEMRQQLCSTLLQMA